LGTTDIVAPGRRPPRYHDHFNAVMPMLMHYFCFTNATTVQLLRNC